MKYIIFVIAFCFCLFPANAQWELIYDFAPIELSISQDTILATYDGKIYSSYDSGEHWALNHSIKTDSILCSYYIISGNTIIGKDDVKNNLFYVTQNFGNSWQKIILSYSFDNQTIKPNFISKLAIKDNYIYVGTDIGLFYSSDYGLNWEYKKVCDTAYNFQNNCNGLMVHIIDIFIKDSLVYVDVEDEGVFQSNLKCNDWKCVTVEYLKYSSLYFYHILRTTNALILIYPKSMDYSTNNGESWNNGYTFSEKGEGNDTNFVNIKSCGDNLLAATNYGVLVSHDLGVSWQSYNSGLLALHCSGITINDNYIFVYTVETWGNEYFFRAKLKDCEIDTTSTEVIELPNPVLSGQFIFPNPASDYITIALPSDANTLKGVVEGARLYDVFGQVYPTPALPASREGVRIDISALPSGVYFVRVGDKVSKFVKI